MCAGAWNDGYDGSADAVAARAVVELGSSMMKLVAYNVVSYFSVVVGFMLMSRLIDAQSDHVHFIH